MGHIPDRAEHEQNHGGISHVECAGNFIQHIEECDLGSTGGGEPMKQVGECDCYINMLGGRDTSREAMTK